MLILPAGAQALLDSGSFSLRYMIRLDLVSGTTGIWNDTYTVSVGGVTYLPIAGNIQFDTIPSTSKLDSESLEVTIGYLSSSVTSIIQNEVWHQRPAVVYAALLDAGGNVQYVWGRFSGFLDQIEVRDAVNDACVVVMTIENNNRELTRTNGDRRSDASQRQRNATDDFFKYSTASKQTKIAWGRNGPRYPS